ncbi:GerMN domain-containing protein [Bacillus sp. H-16]|uniref:GerMN domain-containing protein n=1 Tax=Alteribacter salitolerans TaxID=2912333 RepID=UPI001966AE7C|nr:GerMN domain-containing protein [Alteribacter salitolerans]MBM7096790.1 GerMN domain-containing protein [Alteribacter salitolerans]
MKRAKWLFVTLSAALVLAACGQGTNEEDVSGAEGADSEETAEEVEDTEEDEADAEEDDAEDALEEEEDAEEATEEEETDGAGEDDSAGEDEAAEEEAFEEDEAQEDDVAVLNSVTYYFSDDQLMETYRVTTDQSVTQDEQGAKEVLEQWIAGPDRDGLMGLVPSNVTVQEVRFADGVAYVSFSGNIAEANLGSSGEMMFTEQLAMMMAQFGYEKTQLLIDGEVPGEFLGHMDVSEPFEASASSQYSEY